MPELLTFLLIVFALCAVEGVVRGAGWVRRLLARRAVARMLVETRREQ